METRAKPSSLFAFVVLIAICTFFAQPALGQLQRCDPHHVFHFSNIWLLLPTGTDDTSNLQCAFDHAVTVPRSTVLLGNGTYHTGQVVVFGFVGTFRGIGQHVTAIRTLDRPLQVTYWNWYDNLPTPENGSNPWPSVFAFIGGNITISDLSLYVTENSRTTGWTFDWLYPTVVNELYSGFEVVGSAVTGKDYTKASAAVHRVRIQGFPHADTLTGYNPLNAMYFEGLFGLLRGTLDVHGSQFQQTGGGPNTGGLYNSRVSITHNRYTDSGEGMDVTGLYHQTIFEFAENQVTNVPNGIWLWDAFDSSTIVVSNNGFTADVGVDFDDSASFSGKMTCQLLKNGLQNVTDVGAYLGPGTKDCLVVCSSPNDTVINAGTDNKLVGCQEVTASRTLKEKSALPKALNRKP
ncbi:MAG TPA: hypothetical protein VMT53_08925 [Terriglobales bacterium]|nr:hypothetical protein [Terriglobales bacterium]